MKKKVMKPYHFIQLVRRAEAARIQMERMGVFKKSQIFIDTSKGEGAHPNGYEVTYTVKVRLDADFFCLLEILNSTRYSPCFQEIQHKCMGSMNDSIQMIDNP